MNKELLKKFQLQAGGSHYPGINPEMQLLFARQIVDECIDAVRTASLSAVYTTHDRDRAMSNIADCVKSIEERFQHNAVPHTPKSSPIAPIGGSRL